MNEAPRTWLVIAAALVVFAGRSAGAGHAAPNRCGVAGTQDKPSDKVDVNPDRPLAECGKARPREACQITIDRTKPVSGRTVKVETDTMVSVVLVEKSPFDNCRNEVTRDELPDVSPIPKLVAILVDVLPKMAFKQEALRVQPAWPLGQKLDQFRTSADQQLQAVKDLAERYGCEIKRLRAFYERQYYRDGPAGHDPPSFEADRIDRYDAIFELQRASLPNHERTHDSYKSLYDQYKKLSESTPDYQHITATLDKAKTALDALKRAVAAFEAARNKLQSILEYLEAVKDPEWEARFAVRGDRNAKVTGSVGCTNAGTAKPSLDPPVVYTVVFGSAPRFSLTGGLLLSGVPRNDITVQPVPDAHHGTTVAKTHQEIVDDPTKPQFVPFSFLNIRVGDSIHALGRRWTFNIAPGFGVNANSGEAAAELFAGVALGIDNVFITGGLHLGHQAEPANGFSLGETVPGSLSEVPVKTSWKRGAAIGVSYRIPVK